jgi:hypothetical protein
MRLALATYARRAAPALLFTLPLALAACERPASDGAAAQAKGAKGAVDTVPAAPPARPALGNTAAEAQRCMDVRRARLDSAAAALRADSTRPRRVSGHDPIFAKERGWYPQMPEFRDGVLLPCNRIVVYYGNPNSTRMGALGEFPRDSMLARLRRQADQWTAADPSTPVIPGLHLIAVTAQSAPGPSGHYRAQIRDRQVDSIYQMARSINGILFIDVQVGTDDIRNVLPRFEEFLKRPDVHFAVDPEFYMRNGARPGTIVGTMYAADINYVMDEMTRIVRENNLPPKVLIIHRFRRTMVPDVENVRLRPEVQLVMHMDGWGAPWLKYDSYHDYIVRHPAQFTGWKNFYHNDTKKGDPLTTPQDLLQLWPEPLYIQYQ